MKINNKFRFQIILIAIIALLLLIPVPFIRIAPGPLFNTIGTEREKDVITISGTKTYESKGELNFTTVSETGGPFGRLVLIDAISSWIDPTEAVVPASDLYPENEDPEIIKKRNEKLNATYFGRLHNSLETSIPAVRLYHARVRQPRGSQMNRRAGNVLQDSLITLVQQNELWSVIRKRNFILSRFAMPDGDLSPMTNDEKANIRLMDLRTMETSTTNVAGIIPCNDLKMNKLLTAEAQYDAIDYKKQRVAIQRWLTGGVANHQTCVKCGEELSRKHAIICSGALPMLETHFATLLNEQTDDERNRMDQ